MPKARTNTHWSKIGEAGSSLGIRLLLLCYQLFGRTIFRVFLFPVIGYFYLFNSRARNASKDYLSRIRPFVSVNERTTLTPFRHLWCFGELLLDKFLVWMGHIKQQDIVFETLNIIEHMKGRAQGGIIVVSHLGNTEICSAIAHKMPDVKVTMLVYTQHAEKFNRMLKKSKDCQHISMMQVTDMSPATAMDLSEKVEAGEFIVIAGDRTPVQNNGRTTQVNFLGSLANFPQGAFILANLLKCPVYLMFCLKQQDQYHIYIELFATILAAPRKQRSKLLDQAVCNYAQRLQSYCLKYPLQWFNFYHFWQDTGHHKDS